MKLNRYRVVMLRAGTFRGQSPSVPLRFSSSVIAAGAKSMLGKPVRIANPSGMHEESAQLVAGRVVSVGVEHGALLGVVELDPATPGFATAKALFDGLLAIGGVPNVSIDGAYVADVRPDLHEVKEIQFTALTVVPRGACNDLMGCGVVAALSGVSMETNTDTNATDAAAPAATTTAPAVGTVTFTVVNETSEKKAEPCGCKDAEAKLAAMPTLEAKLSEATQTVESLKAELAAEKARVPLLVELATVLPELKTDNMSALELKAALAAAKLAPAPSGAARKTLLADAPTPVDARKQALAELSERVGRYMQR